jgi:hypothetical protein
MGSKAGGYGMNRHKKPASTVTAKLTGTSQSMTTIQSHHSVNSNTASNAGTDPALLEVEGVK